MILLPARAFSHVPVKVLSDDVRWRKSALEKLNLLTVDARIMNLQTLTYPLRGSKRAEEI